MVYHKHHIIENIKGQRKRLNKTITLSIQEHADIHKHYYDLWGFQEDYMAWKCLSGQIGKEDIFIEKSRIGGLKNTGKEKSPKHKQSISKSITEWHHLMNTKRSEEHKKKISESMMGNKNSQNHKSDEYKQKQSLAMKKAWEKRKKNKKV